MSFAWDVKARFYGARETLFGALYNREYNALKRLAHGLAVERHLDLGSGLGTSLGALPPARQLVLSDASIHMLSRCLGRFPAAQPVQLNANHTLPFQSQCFSLVTAIGLFEYLAQPVTLLQEIHRIMSADATLLFTTSSPGLLNSLRALTGNKPQTQTSSEVMQLLAHTGFMVYERSETLMQHQWRCQKN